MTYRLRSWRERIGAPLHEPACPPLIDPDPMIDMQRVVAAMLGMDPDAPDPEPYEPTQEEIDAWMEALADDGEDSA